MKSIYKPLLFIAALFATTACSNVDDEGLTPDTPVRTKRLTVNTTSDDDETRVVIGQLTDGKYPVLWENEGETLTLIEYDEQTDTYDTYDSDECSVLYNGKQASFSFNNFKEKEGNSFSYNAFSPACDFIKIDEDHCVEFTLPEVQKPCKGADGEYKVDPKAMILYSSDNKYEDGRQPEDCITLKFHHLTAYSRMYITGLKIEEGEKVKSINFIVEDKNSELSGYCLYSGGECLGSKNSVTLDVESLDITSKDFVVWFSTIPSTIEAGFTVEITIGNKIYRRTPDMKGRILDLKAGQISKFTVPMENAEVETIYYEKVTSKSKVTDGQYLIVYETDNVVFNGGLEPPFNIVKNNQEVTITDSKIESSSEIDEASFTLTRNNDGSYYIKSARGYYIGMKTDNTNVDYSNETPLVNTISFDLSGNVKIVSSKAVMYFNKNSDQRRFRYYKSDANPLEPIQLYKKSGNSTADPVPAEDPKITPETVSVTMAATETSGKVENITLENALTVKVEITNGDDWVSEAKYNENNKTVTFNAKVNETTTDRTATITVTATGEAGTTPATATITVTQTKSEQQGGETTKVTDVLNNPFIGVSGTTYTVWSGKKGTSGAVYAGCSAGGNSSIQLRTDPKNGYPGVVSTTSAGKVTKIAVKWNSNTNAARTLDVYAKNSAYSSADDLYDTATQGTKVATFKKSDGDKEMAISGDYTFIGFRSNAEALYLDEVQITWSSSDSETPTTPVAPTVSVSPESLTWTSDETTAKTVNVTVTGEAPSVKATLDNETYFSVSYNESNKTVTVTPKSKNESADARTATVTVTATNEGGVSEPATFTVTQQGKTEQGGGTTEVTDVIDLAFTGVSSSGYDDWSNKKGSNSTAVYSGNTSGNSSTIQMRSNNNSSGIVTTTSGGKVAKIKVEWESVGSNGGTTLNIYTKDTPYNSPADLYGSNSGTLVGSIVKGTSTEFVINNPTATYLGLRSNSGAINFSKIEITWVSDDTTGGNTGGGEGEGGGNTGGEDKPADKVLYTLDTSSITGSNSGYASEGTLAVENVTWIFNGNMTTNPWRLGGKSITNQDRHVYTKTAITGNVNTIELTHGTANTITVNSLTLYVSKNADFSAPVSTLKPEFKANATTTIQKPEGADWSNCYFKFVYNVTVSSSGNSNYFVQFNKVVFNGTN